MASSISSLLSHNNDSDSEEEYEDSIILEPHQASSIESSWLEMMTRDQPPDIKALFDRIIKYLNGQHAIEKIAVREGIARKDVRRVLGTFDGFVIYVSFLSHFSPPSCVRYILRNMLIGVCRHGIGDLHSQQMRVSGQCFFGSVQAGGLEKCSFQGFLFLFCFAMLCSR